MVLLVGIPFLTWRYIEFSVRINPTEGFSYFDVVYYMLSEPMYFLFFFLSLCVAYLCYLGMYRSLHTQIVYRYCSKRAIWIFVVKYSAALAVIESLWFSLSILVFSVPYIDSFCNFDQANSLMHLALKGQDWTGTLPNAFLIFALSFIVCFICFWVIELLLILCWWLFDNIILGLLITFSFYLVDVYVFPSLYSQQYFLHSQWIGQNIFFRFFIPVAYVIVLFILGYVFAERKEFYREKVK